MSLPPRQLFRRPVKPKEQPEGNLIGTGPAPKGDRRWLVTFVGAEVANLVETPPATVHDPAPAHKKTGHSHRSFSTASATATSASAFMQEGARLPAVTALHFACHARAAP